MIIRKARGEVFSKQAQRVFLSHGAADDTTRDELIADLLSYDAGMDCVVSYIETPADLWALNNEFHETALFVIWLAGGEPPEEYHMAKDAGIPILPIAAGSGLFPKDVHGIAKSDPEYRAKLKAQMQSLLLSEEIIGRIKEKAFCANIFLSYRKADVEHARKFMSLFHESFEDVSVWYDNFLTAGHVFDEEIRDAIKAADIFVLLVTPNLLLKNAEGGENYVKAVEYPCAAGQNKPIIAVEAVLTNPSEFAAAFSGIQPIDMYNSNAVEKAFAAYLAEDGGGQDCERLYLRGMAYLQGYSVERDIERAVSLFKRAAGHKSPDAIAAAKELSHIFTDGIAEYDFWQALHWQEKAASLSEEIYGADGMTADFYISIGTSYYRNLGGYDNALAYFQKALAMYAQLDDRHGMAVANTNIAKVYAGQGNYIKALITRTAALEFFEKEYGGQHQETMDSYSGIGGIYLLMKDYAKALEFSQKALTAREQVYGKEHDDTARSYFAFGNIYMQQNEYSQALVYFYKALQIFEKFHKTDAHPDMAGICTIIATAHEKLGNHPKALEFYNRALMAQKKIYGEEHADTAKTHAAIGRAYYLMENHPKALEVYSRLYDIKNKTLGKHHEETQSILRIVQELYGKICV